jgi:putative DNA primase/helicase
MMAHRSDVSPGPTALDAALAYAARGWHVFPCHSPTEQGCSCRRANCPDIGKHPRTKHGKDDATADEATIRRWWRMWPHANVAIATGAVSGLVVLDVDSYKDGDNSLRELEQSYSPLPETVQQLTGGGGVHYLFAHPGSPVKNRVETLGAGLDIRGDGGYIIAAPSLHKSGTCYTWEVLHEPDETPLAPMPPWLLALCQDRTNPTSVDAGAPIPDHQRNATLFRLGASMRAKGFEEAAIYAALWETNQAQCHPPLGEAEVHKIAHSTCRYKAGTATQEKRRTLRASTNTPHGEAPGPETPSTDQPLPYSDFTNAVRFVSEHGQDLRYCYPWSSWLVWTGTCWQRDTSGEVMRRAKQTIKRMARRAEAMDAAAAKALMAHVKASLSTAKLEALVRNAQSEPGMQVQPDDLDRNLWLLNCANGTLDLTDGTLRPHRQADLLTKCLPIAYTSDAQCPTWDTFLWRIMGGSQGDDDPDTMSALELENRSKADERARELIAYLQRTAGYTLTGSTREQCMFLCHGPTKTGKSTYLATLRRLLGAYGKQTDMQTFTHKDRPEVRNDLADLAGARYVYAVESQEGKRLAEGLVKQITGGVDGLKARFLYEELFEFRPQFKAYIGTNHLPTIKDTDDAIWERVRRIPFIVHIPKADRDKDLEEKLTHELPGILAWAVRGCLAWRALNDLQEPAQVVEATQAYRSEMDDIGTFLKDACFLGDKERYRTQASLLLKAYHQWCGQTTMSGKAFAQQLTDRGYESKRSNSASFWLGIGLPAPEEPRQDK